MTRQFAVPGEVDAARARILQVITRQRGRITHEGSDSIAAGFRGKPSLIVTGVLLFFGIVPGLIYWLLGRRLDSLLVQLSEGVDETWVTLTTSGGAADDAAHHIAAAYGQTVARKAASAVAAGTSEAVRAAGSAAVSAGHTVADRVGEARARRADMAEAQAAAIEDERAAAEPPDLIRPV